QRCPAGFFGNLAILLDDETARGLVLFQPVEKVGRHAPVGALRAVFVDDVEEHEFTLRIGTRFFRHARSPSTKGNASACALASSSKENLDGLQIGGSGLAAARVGLHVERKLLAFVQIMHAGALDCRDVNEHIGAAAVLHDKAEALLGVEELNGTCGHSGLLKKTRKGVYAPCKPFAWASYPDFACSWEKAVRPKLQGQAQSRMHVYIGFRRLYC